MLSGDARFDSGGCLAFWRTFQWPLGPLIVVQPQIYAVKLFETRSLGERELHIRQGDSRYPAIPCEIHDHALRHCHGIILALSDDNARMMGLHSLPTKESPFASLGSVLCMPLVSSART